MSTPAPELTARARAPSVGQLALGFVTNFFDTLGVGSFAPTTAAFKARRMVADELIPGTLNVGHTLPTILQALIYVTVIEVDVLTLVLMVAASVAGAWVGAGVVSAWPRRRVQRGMAAALLITAAFIVIRQLGWLPPGSDALGLRGGLLLVALAGNALLGALMTLGVGRTSRMSRTGGSTRPPCGIFTWSTTPTRSTPASSRSRTPRPAPPTPPRAWASCRYAAGRRRG